MCVLLVQVKANFQTGGRIIGPPDRLPQWLVAGSVFGIRDAFQTEKAGLRRPFLVVAAGSLSDAVGVRAGAAASGAAALLHQVALAYKAPLHGGRLVVVDPRHTSQTCGQCGTVDAASRLSQAVFACVACGHGDDADVNAAKNILARGQAILSLDATGGLPGGGL